MTIRSALALSAIIILPLTACQGAKEDGQEDTAIVREGSVKVPAAQAKDVQADPPAQAKAVEQETDDYTFAYSYPSEAAAIPALAAQLDAEREQSLTELRKETADEKREAQKAGYPYRAHSYEKTWERVADLPRWLSLSAGIYTFSGGAHGMSLHDGLVWDKAEGKAIEPVNLFASKAALNAAIKTPFCAALDRQRLKKRGEMIDSGIGEFDKCLDPADHTIILGSSNGRTFDRIGILLAPYDAGPYAEGSYEVTLPVTATMLEAVRPEYRQAFSPKR